MPGLAAKTSNLPTGVAQAAPSTRDAHGWPNFSVAVWESRARRLGRLLDSMELQARIEDAPCVLGHLRGCQAEVLQLMRRLENERADRAKRLSAGATPIDPEVQFPDPTRGKAFQVRHD